MKVLSLFDGIAGCRQALKELNIDCDYYASEIDKYAIQISKANHPDIIHLGDVKDLWTHRLSSYDAEGYEDDGEPIILHYGKDKEDTWGGDFDLLIAGFPCQSFSIAGNQKGFEDERGQLFFELLRILEQVKPKYFLFENVASMSKANQAFISEKLGVEPIMINSAKLTAQQRKRLYWTNIPNVDQPEERGIVLKDIIEDGFVDREKSHAIISSIGRTTHREYFKKNQGQVVFKANNGKKVEVDLLKDFYAFREVRTEEGKRKRAEFRKLTGLDSTKRGAGDKKFIPKNDGKANCLTTGLGIEGVIKIKDMVRKLTPIECERLQGFPDGYCSMVSNTQAYKALGNSFIVPVIKHILRHII